METQEEWLQRREITKMMLSLHLRVENDGYRYLREVLAWMLQQERRVQAREAELWILRNQLGRRNLTFEQRYTLARKLRPFVQQEAKSRRLATLKQNHPNESDTAKWQYREEQETQGTVNSSLAKIVGISERSLFRRDTVEKNGTDEVVSALKTEDISLHQAELLSRLESQLQKQVLPLVQQGLTVDKAIAEIKREQRQQEIQAQIKPSEVSESVDIHTCQKKYRVVYADPPWSYNDACENGGIQARGASGVYLMHGRYWNLLRQRYP